MLTVNHDLGVVELELLGGRLACPGCSGALRPWGWARGRVIRHGTGVGGDLVEHHPRRARCSRCAGTHVLLAVSLAARRADSAQVIAVAIEAKTVSGTGHRVIAAQLGRPPSTVRGWIRSFTACASMITENFSALTIRDAPDAAGVWPLPVAGTVGQALSVLAAYARVLGQRFGALVMVAWVQAGIAACNGWLFCRPWWEKRRNTNPPLRPGRQPRHAVRST